MSLYSVYTSCFIHGRNHCWDRNQRKAVKSKGRRINLGGPALLFRVHIGSSVTYRILDKISALSAGNFGANISTHEGMYVRRERCLESWTNGASPQRWYLHCFIFSCNPAHRIGITRVYETGKERGPGNGVIGSQPGLSLAPSDCWVYRYPHGLRWVYI